MGVILVSQVCSHSQTIIHLIILIQNTSKQQKYQIVKQNKYVFARNRWKYILILISKLSKHLLTDTMIWQDCEQLLITKVIITMIGMP